MLRPEQISLVNQIDDFTCHYATIAMVTGRPIDVLVAEYGNDGDSDRWKNGLDERDAVRIMMKEMILPVPIHTFLLGSCPLRNPGVYMVTVPGLGGSGRLHSVIVTSTPENRLTVLDPQNGREGVKWYPSDALMKSSAGPWLQYLDILRLEDMTQ